MGRDISHRYACICHAESQSRSCPVRASPSYALQHMHVKWHARRNVHRRQVPLGMSFCLRLFAGRYRNRRRNHRRSGRSRSHPQQHGGWRGIPACAPAAAASGAALPGKPPPGCQHPRRRRLPALLHPVLPARTVPVSPGIACLSKSVLTLLIATLAIALSSLRRLAALAIHLCLEGHESLYGRLRDRRDRLLHRQQ